MPTLFAIQIRVVSNFLASAARQQVRYEVLKSVGLPVGSAAILTSIIDRSASVPDLLPGTTITLHGGDIYITAPGQTPPVLADDGSLED